MSTEHQHEEMYMSRMLRGFSMLLILGIAVTKPALTQDLKLQDMTLPKITAETHALDALLGKWNCLWNPYNTQFKKVKVIWTFASVADGLMVYDEFRADNGAGGTPFLGETYRAYNPETKAWTFRAMTYLSPLTGVKSGEWDVGMTWFENGDVIDEIPKDTGTERFRFYHIEHDGFSVIGEKSKDGGQTWSTLATIECMSAQQ